MVRLRGFRHAGGAGARPCCAMHGHRASARPQSKSPPGERVARAVAVQDVTLNRVAWPRARAEGVTGEQGERTGELAEAVSAEAAAAHVRLTSFAFSRHTSRPAPRMAATPRATYRAQVLLHLNGVFRDTGAEHADLYRRICGQEPRTGDSRIHDAIRGLREAGKVELRASPGARTGKWFAVTPSGAPESHQRAHIAVSSHWARARLPGSGVCVAWAKLHLCIPRHSSRPHARLFVTRVPFA